MNQQVILVNQNTTGENGGSLQIGPDKKIYIARNNKNYLGVIQNPNSIGLNCNYVNNAISLNKICYAGLPNFLKNYPISFCGSLSANYSQSNLCPNNNFIITAHATFGASPYQYSIDSINFQASNVFPNLIPKKYVLTVKDVNLEIRKITVKIPDRIIFSLSTSSIKQPDCGYSNGEVTLTTSNGTGPFQYSKDGINFQLSNIFTDLPASTINFVVRDNNGCLTNVQTNIVAVNKFKIYAGKDTGIFIHQTVQLFANDLTNSNFISFKWLPATGLDNPFSQYPFATITNNIEYYVEAKTAQGCTVKDTIHIDVYKEIGIFVPSAFTPNFDNRNDVLKAIPRGIKQLNFFKIFDRFGAMVFSTNIFSIGWDGKNKGVNQNMGSYIWIAQGIDINGNVVYRKGSCTLLK